MPALSRTLALLGLVTLCVATGCETASPATKRPPPQPVITGESDYFAGQVHVTAELGPFRLIDSLPPEHIGGMPVAIDENLDLSRPPRVYAGGRPNPGSAPGAIRTGDGRPRQSLTVTLRNGGATALHLRVAEVRSALGNFVPVPEIFTLEPGQIQALEAMRSYYPAPIDELELVIRLRTADREELQTLHLTLP